MTLGATSPDPGAPDDHVGTLEQMLLIDAAEVALARPEHHRHHVHGHLVDKASGEDLAAHLAGVHGYGPVSGEFLALAIAASTPSTK